MKTNARDYEVNIRWSTVDQVFIAHVVEMPGVMADGATREEAAREIEAALKATIEAAEAHKHPLPEPRTWLATHGGEEKKLTSIHI